MEIEAIEEETDVMSLLANQGGDVDTEDVDEEDQGGKAPATIEEYQALLERKDEIIGKRNKSIKKAKDAQHRTQDERDAALAKLSDNAKSSDSNRSDSEAERLEQRNQDRKDRFEENPLSVFDEMDERNGQIARFVQNELATLRGELTELKSATNPERMKLADQVSTLRRLPELENVGDDALYSMAKALVGARVKAPRGTVSGKRIKQEKKSTPDYGGLTRDELRKKQGFKPRG